MFRSVGRALLRRGAAADADGRQIGSLSGLGVLRPDRPLFFLALWPIVTRGVPKAP